MDYECVRLREDERILRVTFKVNEGGRDRAERESEEVLLWSGPKVEVWEQGVCIRL